MARAASLVQELFARTQQRVHVHCEHQSKLAHLNGQESGRLVGRMSLNRRKSTVSEAYPWSEALRWRHASTGLPASERSSGEAIKVIGQQREGGSAVLTLNAIAVWLPSAVGCTAHSYRLSLYDNCWPSCLPRVAKLA